MSQQAARPGGSRVGNLVRWGIREKLVGVVLAVGAIIFILTAYLFGTLREVAEVEREAERVVQRIRLMDRVVKLTIDMETGARGFVITGREDFLVPYMTADAQVYGVLETLRRDAALRPGEGQLERIEQIALLLDQWRTRVAEPMIGFRREGDPDSAEQIVSSGQGKALTDAIRAAAADYTDKETQTLDQRRERAQRARDDAKLRFAVGAGTAAFSALLALALFGVGLTRGLHGLSVAASMIGAGEWAVQVDERRQDELGDVARAFNLMAKQVTTQASELAAQNEELIAHQESLESSYRELEAIQARTKALFDFAADIAGTMDPDDLADRILRRYLALYGAEAGSVYVLEEPDVGCYRLVAQAGLRRSLLGHTIGLDEGPVGRCAALREPLDFRYPDTALRLPVYGEEMPVQAEICVPLVHLGQTVAVVVVGMLSYYPIPESVSRLSAAMSVQGALAVAGALVHREVERHLQAAREHAAVVERLNAALEEEKHRANEQRDTYLSIITNIRSAACLVDRQSRIVVTNPPFARFFGFRLPPEPGTPLSVAMRRVLPHIVDKESFEETITAYFEHPAEDQEGKVEVVVRDGRRVLHWYVVPVSGVGHLFVFVDNTRLEEIDRMKSEFISTVSHELRTPLTSILGYVDLILEGDAGEVGETQREFLEIVQRNTHRLKELINDLLDIEKIESGRIRIDMEPVDLREVALQVCQTFEVIADRKGLSFRVEVPEEPVIVTGDHDRLVQVASNLVSNAVKYTMEGGIRVRLARDGETVRLAVTDTGIGMTEAEQAQLFSRFFRADNTYTREVGGTGLGLSIVKALVDQHGGTVAVRSAPGKGSTFTVTLTVRPNSAEAVPERAAGNG
jgi:signal transduction histidine kinase/CHASE3 domain sensor protein